MNLAMVIFSATGNTRIIGDVMAKKFERLGATVHTHDITSLQARQSAWDASAYDGIVFGFPVHSLRAPRIARDWLRTVRSRGQKSAMFFTFGGFTVPPAHHSTREILQEQGFAVVASAEFPGAHTFNAGGWRAFEHRPDERDKELAGKYARIVHARFADKDTGVVGELETNVFSDEQLDQFEVFRFKVITRLPSRDGAECSGCGLCEQECPTGAMDAQTGTVDSLLCIACLRCLAVCPEQVLSINDTTGAWRQKLAMGKTTEDELNSQTGTLYL